jgi:hypothetical protein
MTKFYKKLQNFSIIINRMIAEELTEYLIAPQIDVQVRQVLDRLWSCLM